MIRDRWALKDVTRVLTLRNSRNVVGVITYAVPISAVKNISSTRSRQNSNSCCDDFQRQHDAIVFPLLDVCRYQRRHLPRPTRFHYVRICGIDPSLSPRSQEQSDAKADGIRRRSPYRAFVRGGRDDKWEENDDAGRAHLLSKRKPPQCNLSPAASRVPEEESSMGSAATCTIANWRPLHWVRIGLTARWSGPALLKTIWAKRPRE